MKKTILFIYLVLLVTGSMTQVAAGASENTTIYLSNAECKPGESVKISVTVKSNTGFSGFAFNITYDPSKITPQNVEKSSILTGLFVPNTAYTPSTIRVVYTDVSELKSDGELFNITFKAADNITTLTGASVGIVVSSLVDKDLSRIACDVQTGLISIVPKSGESNEPDVIATEEVILSIITQSKAITVGDEIEITVRFSNLSKANLCAFAFRIELPAEFNYATGSGKISPGFQAATGMAVVTFDETPYLMVSGFGDSAYNGRELDVAVFKCTVAKTGQFSVTLSAIDLRDVSVKRIQTSVNPLSVTVLKADAEKESENNGTNPPVDAPSKDSTEVKDVLIGSTKQQSSPDELAAGASQRSDTDELVSWNLKLVLSGDDGYISGYPDGTIGPNKKITRFETAKIIYTLVSDVKKSDYSQDSGRFKDVATDKWYSEAVGFLVTMGIISGYEDGTFRGNNSITRVEFVTIVSKLGDMNLSGLSPFSDIPEGHWAYGFILSAYNNGWVSGYPDGSFGQNRSITRAEAFVIINRVLGWNKPSTHITKYPSDLIGGEWYFDDVMLAINGR